MARLAIFVSGSGTNMENLVRRIREGKLSCEAALVVCDNPEAGAIKRAKRLGVEVALVDREKFSDKKTFEAEIIRRLEEKKIDYIALAGFMRILSPEFVRRFEGRIVNVHPALLPAFPGARAIRDAFEAKVKETGVTVHFVDAGVDTGPVILQEKVKVNPSDTFESLEARIHEVEYQIYPKGIQMVLDGKIRLPRHHHDGEFWERD